MSESNGASSYRRFLQGDATALEELVRTYSDSLIRFAYCFVKDSAVAEDIMEDSFATLLVKRRRFSQRENFRAYLYKIVRNKCIDYLRKQKKKVSLYDVENVLSVADASKSVEDRARNETLYRCMQKLSSQYEEVLYLMYFEDCSVDELCQILKKNKKQVYNLLTRARSALKELIEKEGISYEDL